jgi:hypothetical protein
MTGRTKESGKISLLKFSTDTSMPGIGTDVSTFGLLSELKSKACPKLGGKLMMPSYLLKNYVHA